MPKDPSAETGARPKGARFTRADRPDHGPISVLHSGNIANNAYLNVKALRRAGVDAEVLSDEYYHIMGCPEWEDALIAHSWGDDFNPDWKMAGIGEYVRPSWFKGGLLEASLASILNARGPVESNSGFGERYRPNLVRAAEFLSRSPHLMRLISRNELLKRSLRRAYYLLGSLRNRPDSHVRFAQEIVDRFESAYPDRRGELKQSEIYPHLDRAIVCSQAFGCYDLVQHYGLRPIDGLLSGRRPYVAYEHGTLRSMPFEQTGQGALTALAYYEADHVFVTNSDNVSAVRKLGIKKFSFVPHPVNEEHLAADEESYNLANEIRQRFDASFVVLHPSRQHWSTERHPDWEKGNDIFIRGFARLVKEKDPRALAVMVEWGAKLQETKALLQSLGCADRVHWISPQAHRNFVRWIHASDVVADQFFLGAFGSLTPKAMACGKPVLLYLDEAVHRWCFEELPPVMNVRTPDQVYESLNTLRADVTKKEQIGQASLAWYRKYHSNALIQSKLLDVYYNVLRY